MEVANEQVRFSPKAYRVDRRDHRCISSVPITVQRFLRFGPVVEPGLSLDISMGGMSGLICGAPRVGETVVIKLSLWGSPMEILATVSYSSDARSGFKFCSLPREAEERLRSWIVELEKQEHSDSPCLFLR